MADETEQKVQSILEKFDADRAAEQSRLEEIMGTMGMPGLETGINPQGRQDPPRHFLQQGPLPSTAAQDILGALYEGVGTAAAAGEGAALGARTGLQVMGPRGALVGGLLGAVTGATGGGAASRVSRRGVEQALGLASPPKADDVIADVRSGALEGLMGEAGAQVGLGVMKGARTGLHRLLAGTPTAEQMGYVEQAAQQGILLRPAAVTQAEGAQLIERSLRRTLVGRSRFKKVDLENDQRFQEAVESYADTLFGAARSPQETGALIQAAIKDEEIPQWRLVTRGLYKRLGEQTNYEPIVSTADLYPKVRKLAAGLDETLHPQAKALANKVEQEMGEAGPTTGLTVRRAEGEEGTLQGLKVRQKSEAPQKARPLNFMEAHDLRSFLLDIRRTGEALPDHAQALAGQLAHDLDTAMAQASLRYAERTGKPIYNDWRIANESTKIGHEIFDSAVIRQALSRNPEDVVAVAFKKDALTETQRIRQVLQNHPEAWSAYQRASLEHLFKNAQAEGGGISGHLFAAQADKVGPAVLKETFGDQYQHLKNFLEIGKRMDVRQTKGEGPGLLWTELGMYLSVPSAAVGGVLASGSVWPLVGATATLTTYLWTTRHLSEMLNNKQTATALLQLMDTKPGTQAFTRFANQLASRYAGGDMLYLPGDGRPPIPAGQLTQPGVLPQVQ